MQELNETIRRIKHEFMTYRNGVVADTLRKSGMPFEIIFGLQLPQIREIASAINSEFDFSTREEISRVLRADTRIRESRILAMGIMPPETLTEDEARQMLHEIMTREEADLLPFLLLRHTPYLKNLTEKLLSESAPNQNMDKRLGEYMISALQRFIL